MNPDLGYNLHVQRAYAGMIELGLLKVTKPGYYMRSGIGANQGKLTRYVATDTLVSMFTDEEQSVLPALLPPLSPDPLVRVRVKDTDGKRGRAVAAEPSDEVMLMSENLQIINTVLNYFWIDISLPDEEISKITSKKEAETGNEYPIDFRRRSLYRVSNSHDLTTGGRFYGPFWQNMPSELRRHLVIDGKDTVEIDFSRMHPTMLYAREGLDPPGNAYSGVVDLLEIAPGTDRAAVRSMVKQAFNAMLNAEKPLRNAPKGVEPGNFGLKWRQVSDAILKLHHPIAHLFYSGMGLRLQRMDSDIAEAVMLNFAQSNIPVLPVHDSFIVHHGLENSLEVAMKQAFLDVIKRNPDLKVTPAAEHFQTAASERLIGPDGIVNMDLDLLIEANDVGYQHRLAAHRKIQSDARKAN
ncbi:hypothetical protein GZH79_07340 [Loktanella sp. SALINAS62]|nr:hypothetical protein [Loktanella sp. SALINAS62]